MIINLSMLGSTPTGLGVYADHCAKHLENKFNCTVISSFYKPSHLSQHIESSDRIAIGSNRWSPFLRTLYLWYFKTNVTSLMYTPTHHGFFRHENQIITIHDLIPVYHASQNRFQHFYYKWLLPRVIRKTKAIFTVSEAAKKDIASYYKVQKEKIFVVPCGIDTEYFVPDYGDLSLKNDYLLVVGASYPHKNIAELLENWKLWIGHYKVKIVSCRGPHKLFLQELIEKLDLVDNVEILGYVTNIELRALIQSCKTLVFPSLLEGFGMPPMEAMACGRPVIVSDIEVHKEIMKDVPIYITPGDRDSWKLAFTLLQDKALVEKKIGQGLELVRQYSWERSGEKLVESLLAVAPELLLR